MKPLRGSFDYEFIRQFAGTCPACQEVVGDPFGIDIGDRAVIYRRSRSSVTFRCNRCGLQWTITWRMLMRAARAHDERRGTDWAPLFDAIVEDAWRAPSPKRLRRVH